MIPVPAQTVAAEAPHRKVRMRSPSRVKDRTEKPTQFLSFLSVPEKYFLYTHIQWTERLKARQLWPES